MIIDDEKEMALLGEAASLRFSQMAIGFDQLSYWQKPGILCLTASQTDLTLLSLVNQLTLVAEKLAIAIDERPYLPHVTLSRKARQPVALTFAPIAWPADSFCLFESCPTDTGVEYHALKHWPAL